jgi:DNA polymerase-3 subunit gamma/tau
MSDTPDTGYQVLARKYRPQTFADLIGQDAMVRTLKNAFEADRIAQAFMLTGIRGTGKTTTARIIAKGLNCIGPDGTGGPTTDPCGVCENCKAIAEGRHVDVMEMDAASHTGVQNIRDAIIETVSYRAAQARYKIFIIDEVHMLSTSAFNALLKTLEEPPAHVKFLFATTEIRKVPVTVLSRCQRFDLRRIEPEVMIAHLKSVAAKENAEIAEEALALITRASEGSVRDAMSLLDQAIAHGAGETGADQVRAMLGLADRGRVLDLFEAIMGGDAAGALAELGGQYADGADPVAVLRDLAEVTHWLSVVKITPDAAEDPTIGAGERARGQELSQRLPMRALTRMWQMLLKALEEVRLAPNAMMAAEMAIIRLTHVAELPTPGDLVKKLTEAPPSSPVGRSASSGAPSSAPVARAPAPPMSTGPGPRHRAHRPPCSAPPAPTSRAIPPGTASWRLSKTPGTSSSCRGEILPAPRVLRPGADRAGADGKRPARPHQPAETDAAGGDGRDMGPVGRHRRRAHDHGGRGHREGRTDGGGGEAPADAGHPRRLSRSANRADPHPRRPDPRGRRPRPCRRCRTRTTRPRTGTRSRTDAARAAKRGRSRPLRL